MSLANTKDAYGWGAIALHWIAAFGVVAMFVTGFQAGLAEQANDRAARGALMGLHISIGATLFVFFVARIALHYSQVQPAKPNQAPWLNTLTSVVQNLLLLGLFIQLVSGPLAVWSGGRAINAFDLFSLPSPFAERNNDIHEAAEVAHLVGRVLIFFTLALHVLGAFKHLMLDRDGAFQRMLWPAKLSK